MFKRHSQLNVNCFCVKVLCCLFVFFYVILLSNNDIVPRICKSLLTLLKNTWKYIFFLLIKNIHPQSNNTQGTHLEFIKNCHIRWNFCFQLISKIMLRSSPSSDRPFNNFAYYRFNKSGTLHLSFMKNHPSIGINYFRYATKG